MHAYSDVLTHSYDRTASTFFFYISLSSYVVCTIFPPLLPSVYTVCVGISVDRLSSKNIACTQPDSTLVAGKVTKAFFDKTGTLTEEYLSFVSVRSLHEWENDTMSIPLSMSLGMAVCHTLTKSRSGTVIGNPVDQAMFDASGACFVGSDGKSRLQIVDKTGRKVSVVRFFDFDHDRMTQTVVVKDISGTLLVFVKGSSDSLAKICDPDTLPASFSSFVREGASIGLYQICLGMKELLPTTDLRLLTRAECEQDLDFLGVVNFKNHLRDNAAGVVNQLREGGIDSVIITGDAIQSGVCIAKEAGIIGTDIDVFEGAFDDEGGVVWTNGSAKTISNMSAHVQNDTNAVLAVTGACWRKMLETDAKAAMNLKDNIRVFGRCTPPDKASIVMYYNHLDEVTAMIGDGGNDCGALKAAHIGVALSDSEASIVASFTSLNKDLSSVVDIIREGRCSLASALACYKYMIMYGQVETINQLINAYFAVTFSDWCWVFMDGVWVITLAFTLPLAQAAKSLSPSRPTNSLLGLQTLISVLGILLLNFMFTISALLYLWHQNWFQCRKVSQFVDRVHHILCRFDILTLCTLQWINNDVAEFITIGDNYESEVVFLVTGFQYIASAVVYNSGFSFRRSGFRNYVFVALATTYMCMHFYITLVPGTLSCLWRVNCENDNVLPLLTTGEATPIQNIFNTTLMPSSFRVGLLCIMVANLVAIFSWELVAVNKLRQLIIKASKRPQNIKQTDETASQYSEDDVDP
jgi:magnesium-transporting ATPase (P-type)